MSDENDPTTPEPQAGEPQTGEPERDTAAPETAPMGGGETPEAVPDEFAVLEKLQAENAELKDRLLRAMADVDNMRKRTERQLADAHKYAVANFARDMLTVADDLARALAAVPEDQRGDEMVQTLLGGVEAVERELAKLFAAHNIERIEPEGEPFDPNLHEALFEMPGSGHPDGHVAQVVQPGYRLHDRLLRPARVGVAKGGQAAEPTVDTKV